MPHLRMAFLTLVFSCCVIFSAASFAQAPSLMGDVDLTRPQDYVLKRVSSYDRSGGNADYRKIAPGATLTVLGGHASFAANDGAQLIPGEVSAEGVLSSQTANVSSSFESS